MAVGRMAPQHHAMHVTGRGHIKSGGRKAGVWGGQHTPDINELLVILSAAKIPSPGVIVFSGMGNDGATALPIFEAAGGRVWAQAPASAVCPAMPQAAIDSGLVKKTGDPEAHEGGRVSVLTTLPSSQTGRTPLPQPEPRCLAMARHTLLSAGKSAAVVCSFKGI